MGLFSSIKPKVDKGNSASTTSISRNFHATSFLDVLAIGYNELEALAGRRRLEQIRVRRVGSQQIEYTSWRTHKDSDWCALVRHPDQNRTLISTTYHTRFSLTGLGPSGEPRMHILPDNAQVTVDAALDKVTVDAALANRGVPGEEVVKPKRLRGISDAQVFGTSWGEFQWRYGGGEERTAAQNADSLLVMECTDDGRRVALLVRNAEFRTPGSDASSGGNGGRLVLDLRKWQNESRARVAMLEAFVVASCILMLKREVDHFMLTTVAILG